MSSQVGKLKLVLEEGAEDRKGRDGIWPQYSLPLWECRLSSGDSAREAKTDTGQSHHLKARCCITGPLIRILKISWAHLMNSAARKQKPSIHLNLISLRTFLGAPDKCRAYSFVFFLNRHFPRAFKTRRKKTLKFKSQNPGVAICICNPNAVRWRGLTQGFYS